MIDTLFDEVLKVQDSKKELSKDTNEIHSLVLCNDEVNSFDFVIATLVEICNHDYIQAEQCAFITHYKGKCEVKIGNFDELIKIKRILIDRGLTAIIEKI